MIFNGFSIYRYRSFELAIFIYSTPYLVIGILKFDWGEKFTVGNKIAYIIISSMISKGYPNNG